MADNTDNATKDSDILQHLSEVHLQNPLAGEDPKRRYVGASGTGTSGQADTAEELGLDRTYPHELMKPASSITRQALTWNPQWKRKRGQPCNSWRRDNKAELKQHGTNWTGMARAAQDRVRWRGVVNGLCSIGSDGHKVSNVIYGIKQKCLCYYFLNT